jgi:hypothetical protein
VRWVPNVLGSMARKDRPTDRATAVAGDRIRSRDWYVRELFVLLAPHVVDHVATGDQRSLQRLTRIIH